MVGKTVVMKRSSSITLYTKHLSPHLHAYPRTSFMILLPYLIWKMSEHLKFVYAIVRKQNFNVQ